jgi:putative transcriptional regulator
VRNRLRVERAARAWSQSDLAERVGVSRQTIHAIEAEKYDPSLPLAFRLARVLELAIEELFQFDPDGERRDGAAQKESAR